MLSFVKCVYKLQRFSPGANFIFVARLNPGVIFKTGG